MQPAKQMLQNHHLEPFAQNLRLPELSDTVEF
jgi:hypothetical protein